MPASLIAVTEGSGKNLESWQWVVGSNTVERQIIAQGEQHLASYVANFQGTATTASTATAASHIFQVMAGASLKVRIRRIEVYQSAMATAATVASVGLIRLTTAGTGGGAQSVLPLDASDAAAGATMMTLPTVKGSVGAFVWLGSMYLMQTVAASAQLNEPILVLDFDRPRSKPLIIAAGAANGIALHLVTAVAGATVWCNVWLDESNF
jgi:hypothetical protein